MPRRRLWKRFSWREVFKNTSIISCNPLSFKYKYSMRPDPFLVRSQVVTSPLRLKRVYVHIKLHTKMSSHTSVTIPTAVKASRARPDWTPTSIYIGEHNPMFAQFLAVVKPSLKSQTSAYICALMTNTNPLSASTVRGASLQTAAESSMNRDIRTSSKLH